jgi:hypothetical protein
MRSAKNYAAILAGSALALVAALVPAQAAAGIGAHSLARHAPPAVAGSWRLDKVIAVRGSDVILIGLDAVSAGDAWVAGVAIRNNGSGEKPLLEHWDGKEWRPVALPRRLAKQFGGEAVFGIVGASSTRNVWVFDEDGRYLHFNGKHWTLGRLPGRPASSLLIGSTVVLSRNDVWAFGGRQLGPISRLKFAPYAARFNGRRWATVPVPGKGIVGQVSPVHADDMWATTGVLSSGAGPAQRPAVLRWNGANWRTAARQPRLPRQATLATIFARSDSDVWVGGGAPNSKSGTSELARHWNGRSWAAAGPRLSPSADDRFLASLVPDGHGGLWGIGTALPGPARLWHYQGGSWSAPIRSRWDLYELAAVPGTGSTWAIGLGTNAALIAVHGPVPR